MSTLSAQELEEIARGIQVIQWTRYAEAAAMTVIIYDYFISIGEEKMLLWQPRLSLGKILFFVLRYYVVFTAIFNTIILFSPRVTNNLCSGWIIWQFFTGVFAYCLSEYILCLRLYAMYARNKKMLLLLSFSLFVTVFSLCAVYIAYFRGQRGDATPLPGLPIHFCSITNLSSKHIYAYWLPFICFDTLLLCLALFKGYESLRHFVYNKFSERRSGVLDILVKNSLLYFIVVSTTYFVTFLMWLTLPLDFLEIPIGFPIAMASTMSQRLLLEIRRKQQKDQRSYSFNTPQSSTILDL